MSADESSVVNWLHTTKTHLRRWLLGGLCSVVDETNETKQATQQSLTAIYDVRAIV